MSARMTAISPETVLLTHVDMNRRIELNSPNKLLCEVFTFVCHVKLLNTRNNYGG